jgi:hypothetical protein
MMTLIQVFDRLCGKRVSRIDFKNGAPLICPRPMLVEYHDAPPKGEFAELTIEASEDGLVLHFNAETSPGSGLHGQMEPLSNIAYVS